MQPALLGIAILLGLSSCNGIKFGPAAERHLPTDSAMIRHENPDNKSSTGVGIGME
jgi:hypothetical protein